MKPLTDYEKLYVGYVGSFVIWLFSMFGLENWIRKLHGLD